MHTCPKVIGTCLFLSTLLNCNASSGRNQQPPQQPTLGSGGGTAQTGTGNGIGTTTTGSGTDIVIVVALGNENPDQSSTHASAIQQLLTTLGSKIAGKDARIAIIASNTAAVSGVRISTTNLSTANTAQVRQLNFELAPKDAFLGSVVAGCAASANVLDSTHAAGSIQVCGQAVPIPAHSWSWAVADLAGKLADFLRPSASRYYLIIASNDVQIVTAQQFHDMAAAQNPGKNLSVSAIIPSTLGAPCSSANAVATQISQAVSLTSGKAYSYCSADWTTSVADFVAGITF